MQSMECGRSVNQSTIVNVKVARTHANVGSSLGSISQLGTKSSRNTWSHQSHLCIIAQV